MKKLFVCGDCAAKVLKAGGRRDTKTKEIGYEKTCEIHPGTSSMHATSIVLVRDSYVVEPPKAPEMPPLPPELPFIGIGPVTEIATRLVCAWSNEEPVFDEGQLSLAVLTARRILALTEGR